MSHGHSHGGGNCEHESADIDHSPEIGIQYSLYKKIDMLNIECLNEGVEGSGKTVFKEFEQRLNREKYVESDADEELVFNIPFTGNVKLKGFRIIGANDESHPKRVRLFKNRPAMTFDDVKIAADQEFELQRDPNGDLEYTTKIVSFSSVHHLTMHFPGNFGADATKIYYIGLRGEFSEAHFHGVTICNYEIRPNVAEHKNDILDHVNQTNQ